MILVTLASEKMPTPKSSNNMSSPQSSSFSVVKMGKSIKSIMVSIPSLDRSRKNSAISLNLQHQQSPPNSPTSPLKPIIGAQKIEISTSTHQLPITLPAKEAEQSNYNVQSNGSAASILLASARERLKKNEHVRTGSLELCNHSSGYSLQPRSTNGRMVAATAQATNLGAVVMVRSPLKNVTTKLPHSDSTSLNLNASAGELYSYASSNLVNEFNEQDLHAVTRPQKPLVSLHKLSIERRLSFKQNVLNSPTTDPDLASTLVALSKKQEKQKRLQRLKIQLATWYVAQMTAALIVLSLYLATSITPSLAYYQQDVTELTVMFGCFDIWFCLTMLNRFRSGVLASVKPAPAPADTAAAGQGVSTSARQATVQTIGIQFLSQLFRFCKRLLCIKYEKGESECEGRESIVTSLSEVSSWREEEQGERDGIRQGEVIRFASEHAFVEETSLWAMNKDDDSDD